MRRRRAAPGLVLNASRSGRQWAGPCGGSLRIGTAEANSWFTLRNSFRPAGSFDRCCAVAMIKRIRNFPTISLRTWSFGAQRRMWSHERAPSFSLNRVLNARRFFASTADELHTRHNFSTLTEQDLAFFRKILGNNGVITDSDDLENFNVDWMVRIDK